MKRSDIEGQTVGRASASGGRQDDAWKAVVDRNARFDGQFVYAVKSTGIYCRPSCPSRRPHRSRVIFFSTPEQAERSNYRECRRCRPRTITSSRADEIVREACAFIESKRGERITLSMLSGELGVSPFHLQRTFKKAVGVTPAQYASARRIQLFKSELVRRKVVTEAIYEAGYGSGSRVYENSDSQLGMTPAAYRRGGLGAFISFTTLGSPLGRLLVAATDRGICAVKLGSDDSELERSLRREYGNAAIERDDARLGGWVSPILEHLNGRLESLSLPLDVKATAFQRQVWSALQHIPIGETRSYSEIATEIGKPSSVRAVARACASNPVAVIVPCHRVIRSDGELGGYRWGLERKRELLKLERARSKKQCAR